jgi:hypothetical protein
MDIPSILDTPVARVVDGSVPYPLNDSFLDLNAVLRAQALSCAARTLSTRRDALLVDLAGVRAARAARAAEKAASSSLLAGSAGPPPPPPPVILVTQPQQKGLSIHEDFWPILRAICAGEAIRRESKKDRRFQHYLSKYNVSEPLLQLLSDGFGAEGHTFRMLHRKSVTRPICLCSCPRCTPAPVLFIE